MSSSTACPGTLAGSSIRSQASGANFVHMWVASITSNGLISCNIMLVPWSPLFKQWAKYDFRNAWKFFFWEKLNFKIVTATYWWKEAYETNIKVTNWRICRNMKTVEGQVTFQALYNSVVSWWPSGVRCCFSSFHICHLKQVLQISRLNSTTILFKYLLLLSNKGWKDNSSMFLCS